MAFGKILRHLPGQLDVDEGRASLLPDDGVDHLDRLRHRPADHRAGNGLEVLLLEVERRGTLLAGVAPEVEPRSGAGFVVIHALLQEGDQLVAGPLRQMPELGKAADGFHGLDLEAVQSRSAQLLLDALGGLPQRQDPADGISLLLGDQGKVPLPQLLHHLPHLVVGLQIGKLLLLFGFLPADILGIAHHVEGILLREAQLFPELGVCQGFSLVSQGDHRPALGITEFFRRPAFAETDMVHPLQQIEVLKGIGRPCRPGFLRIEGAAAHHFFDLATAVRAVPAGPLVKGPLAQKDLQVRLFQRLRRKIRAQGPLRSKDSADLLLHHIPRHGGHIVPAFVPLSICESGIPQEHLTDCAVPFGFHPLLILVDGLQDLSVLFVRGDLPVGAETTALGQMEQDAHKGLPVYSLVQRADPQGIDILQRPVKEVEQLLLRDQSLADHQTSDPLVAVAMPPQTAARPASLPAGCRQGCPILWMLRRVKHPHAHVQNAARPVHGIQGDRSPADRSDTNIQADRIRSHRKSSNPFFPIVRWKPSFFNCPIKRDNAPRKRGVSALRSTAIYGSNLIAVTW